ncbi:MAG TPA: alpha/beta hydrolase [Burkholderiaceae bacterium]|nr:alpha/beta hydrolase [Burkholderiaceae bacterium]
MNRPERGRLRFEHLTAEVVALASPSPFPVFDAATLRELARGDGHGVLVLPASFRSDRQTARLRAFLGGLGYAAYGWDLGVDLGPTAPMVRGTAERLAELAARHGAVSLVGFSMGGLFARLLAARDPAQVRQVITVCSPIVEPARSVWIPLEPVLGLWPGVDLRALAAEIAAPPPVPSTCIYSRDDGIVRWTHCLDPSASSDDNIEVSGRHVTMPHNAQVVRILAARLARRFGPA